MSTGPEDDWPDGKGHTFGSKWDELATELDAMWKAVSEAFGKVGVTAQEAADSFKSLNDALALEQEAQPGDLDLSYGVQGHAADVGGPDEDEMLTTSDEPAMSGGVFMLTSDPVAHHHPLMYATTSTHFSDPPPPPTPPPPTLNDVVASVDNMTTEQALQVLEKAQEKLREGLDLPDESCEGERDIKL
jgi:hypothetical protein